jgi:chromosome segregation ATPase
MKLEQAKIARNTRKDHFDTFPPIRERYQGAYDRAEEEFRKHLEEWSFVSTWTDTYFKALQSETDGEDTTSRKIQKEPGSPTLDNYIEKVVGEKLALAGWSKLSELQTQVQELQSNDRKRATEHAEYKTALSKIQVSCKAMESKQTYLNGQVEAVRKRVEGLGVDVTTVKQLAAVAVDIVGSLDKLVDRVDQVLPVVTSKRRYITDYHYSSRKNWRQPPPCAPKAETSYKRTDHSRRPFANE